MDPIIIAKMDIYEYKYKKKGELIKKSVDYFFSFHMSSIPSKSSKIFIIILN